MKPQPDSATVAVLALMRGSTVVSAEMLALVRDVRLCELALHGDPDAAIRWLQRHGGCRDPDRPAGQWAAGV